MTTSEEEVLPILFESPEGKPSLPSLETHLFGEVPEEDSKKSWFICFVVFLSNVTTFGILYGFSIFLIQIGEDFEVGRGAVSLVFATASSLMLLMGFVTGVLIDKLGPRSCSFVGALLVSSGLILSSFTIFIWQLFITYSILMGFGLSLILLSASTTLPQWFSTKYRGMATGLAVSGTGVGVLTFPLISEFLSQWFSWRETFLILGELVAIIFIFCSVFLVRRTYPAKKSISSLTGNLLKREFLLLFIGSFFVFFGYQIPIFHISSYAQDFGISESSASIILALMGLSSIIGRISLGYLSDKVGRKTILQLSTCVMALSTTFWYYYTDVFSISLYSFAYGFFSGSIISTLTPLVADYFGVDILSLLMGIIYTSSGIGTLLGAPISGFIYDSTGEYTIAILVCASSFWVALALFIFLPRVEVNQI